MTDGLLVPRHFGPEKIEITEMGGAKAFTGSGLEPERAQHMTGSDAVRWAIALQQLQDDRDYATLDAAKAIASRFYFVMQERNGARLKSKPYGYDCASATVRKAVRIDSYPMPIQDGLLLDAGVHMRDLVRYASRSAAILTV